MKVVSRAAFSGIFLLFLTSCATTLAPDYDRAIVDGLTSTNAGLMELFASVSSGTSQDTFAQREKNYNALIGSLDALALQARARPLPKNKATKKVNEYLRKRGVGALDGEEAPSAAALDLLAKTVTKMRDTDRKQGLTAMEVAAFKGQAAIYMDQAMTYESFLER